MALVSGFWFCGGGVCGDQPIRGRWIGEFQLAVLFDRAEDIGDAKGRRVAVQRTVLEVLQVL